jgi:hypothetical protein
MIPEPENKEPFMKMDGYDDCIVGVVEQFGRPPILCYDKRKIISKLIDDVISYDEAEEFFEYNQIGAYVGDSTPCFVTIMTKEEKEKLEDFYDSL